MSNQRRLEPLKRRPKKRPGSWGDVQSRHPGVRDPRSIRVANWPPLVNAAIIATCAFVTALAILSASLASPVGAVDEWHEWRAEGGEFRIEHPAGWAVRELGSPEQLYLVVVRSPWVRIHVISEGGLASVAELYRQIDTGGARYHALETVHQSTGDTWADQVFGDLEEGGTGRTSIGGRRAVWSQFKYSGGYIEHGEPMVGYRATIIGDNRGVIASAVAPSEHWEEFKPIALHVLKSIRFSDESG